MFDMGWGVLFMGIGGELALTVDGLTEKAISHWLEFRLAKHDRKKASATGTPLYNILDNTRRVPAVFVN